MEGDPQPLENKAGILLAHTKEGDGCHVVLIKVVLGTEGTETMLR